MGTEIISYFLTATINPGMPKMYDPRNRKYRDEPVCEVCNVYSVVGSYHCEDCDICVLEYDHHCPWTGKCIGKYNNPFFNLFVCWTCVFLIYIPVYLMIW